MSLIFGFVELACSSDGSGGSQSLSKSNLRFALGYIQGRRALSSILLVHSVDGLRVPLDMCSIQTKFKICVGVRSGPKGPVMDLSIVGLESLSKANLRFALGYVQSEPKGPVIDSSICGGAPGRLGKMLKHSTVWRPQCLSNQNLRFCVGVRSGPKGPVTDFSTFGLESLFKQNLKILL